MRFLEFSQALFFKRSHKGFRVINFSHSVLLFIILGGGPVPGGKPLT